jgi:hypothetical protein
MIDSQPLSGTVTLAFSAMTMVEGLEEWKDNRERVAAKRMNSSKEGNVVAIIIFKSPLLTQESTPSRFVS